MNKFLNIFFFLLLSTISVSVFSQSYNIPIYGYSEIHTSSGTLFDDGGSLGNYSIRANGKTTIYPASSLARITLKGTYDIENYNRTKLIIYNGDTNSTQKLFENTSNSNGTISVQSTVGPITIVFIVDSDTPKSGFELIISVCDICPTLPQINTQVLTDSTTLITWNGPTPNGGWLLEYKNKCNFAMGTGTLIATNDTSIILTNLEHCANYGARLYTPCDTSENSCPRVIVKKCWIQCQCELPITFSGTSTIDSIRVYWSHPEGNIDWTVLLLLDGEVIDSTITTNHFAVFDSLSPMQCYVVIIYNNCHNVSFDSICKTKFINICTKCPCPEVFNLRAYSTSHSISTLWTEPNDTIEWTVELYKDTILISTIITNDTTAFFDGLIPNTYYNYVVYNNCNDSIICPKLGDIWTKCVCPIAENIHISNVSNGNVLVAWDNDPSSPGWILRWNRKGTNSYHFDTTITNYITLPIADTIGYYNLVVFSYCDDFNIRCADSILFINMETAGNCMNYTDLYSTDVTATYGTFKLPYLFNGLFDRGYLDIYSRHTVHLDTSERDLRTGDALRTIPKGEAASVRLGNWDIGAQAESLTYRYEVDTNIYDLMYLQYAVVLEDPDHTPEDQPRFTLEILNENNQLIDSICGFADFIASNSLGWNSVSGTNIIWKDWTKVGFDISKYHGQVIKVRLTSYDCREGGHFGYAYYTLKCGTKVVTSTACGETQTNIFSAPEGFSYKWYSSSAPSTMLSNKRVLEIVTDSTQNYFCIVSSLDNPSCSFIIDAYAGRRFPLADFTYSVNWQPCFFEVQFTNNSKISSDGINPLPSGIKCETIKWIFDNQEEQFIDNPIKKYSSSGDYNVKLVAGLADNLCTDTLEMIISLESPTGILKIIGDSSLCEGETTTLTSTLEGDYNWNTGETSQSITVNPKTDFNYMVQVMDTSGCPHFANKLVRVHPNYDFIDIYDTICDNYEYNAQGTILIESGIYRLELISVYGCDSNVVLHLMINPAFSDTTHTSICDNQEYEFQNQVFDSTGVYEIKYNTMLGCDSIYLLYLIVNKTYSDTIFADIYKGNTYRDYGFNENATGFYSHNFQTINLCDSNIYLDLQVDKVMFPNCVTPNGDGINDIFEIHNLIEQKAFPENELIIYTRQGKLIYEFRNISKKEDFWSPNKTNTPTGTYYYRFKGKRHDKTIDVIGVIEVLR